MNTTLFKEVRYSLSHLIQNIDMGEIGLPDIQRPFVWTASKVRDLFDSMYRGFPVGYLLFWSSGSDEGVRQIGLDTKQKPPRLVIVDGQQRLTSLYAVLRGKSIVASDYSIQRIQIAFRPRDAKFEVADAAIRKDPEFIPDISQLWIGDATRSEFVHAFLERLCAAAQRSKEDRVAQENAIDRLHDLQNYPFTAMELASAASEEQVADVFVRINSKGVSLNQADFILTLMSVFWDQGRFKLEGFCRAARDPSLTGAPSPYNHFIRPHPDQLLRVGVALAFRRARLEHVYSLLRGKDMDTGQFSDERRVEQFATLEAALAHVLDLTNWHEFLKVLMRAGFRSATMVSSQNALLYSYAMFMFGKRDFHVNPYVLRDVIARWFFFVSLTGRYTSSPESAMEEDLARLRAVHDAAGFVGMLDEVVASGLTEDFWRISLPNDLATSSGRSPSLFAYYAALNLLNARVLFSELRVAELLDPALKAKKTALERHHLFPRNYLKQLGITDIRETNQIANFALLEWPDNISISDSSPADYFPRIIEERKPSEDDLAQLRYWHALPEGWETLRYSDFLVRRRQAIAQVIHDGFDRLGRLATPQVSEAAE